MIHSALARKHSLGENQEIWTKFRRCSGHDNSRTCREFRFSMRAKNRAIKFLPSPAPRKFIQETVPLLPLSAELSEVSNCENVRTFLHFVFFFPASTNGWMIVEMDWRAILIDSISKNTLSLSFSLFPRRLRERERERELLNKLEVESARSMSIR